MSVSTRITAISHWVTAGLTRDEVALKLRYFGLNALCVVANFCLNATLQTQLNWPLWLSAGTAYLAGGQLNFLFHNKLTFKARQPSQQGLWRRWKRFMVGNLSTGPLNVLLQSVLVGMGCSLTAAFSVALVVTGLLNWWYNKHWAFRHYGPDEHPFDPPLERDQDN